MTAWRWTTTNEDRPVLYSDCTSMVRSVYVTVPLCNVTFELAPLVPRLAVQQQSTVVYRATACSKARSQH